MGNEMSNGSIASSCKIVIQSSSPLDNNDNDATSITTHVTKPHETTWSQLTHRTIENDYLLSMNKLLPFLVQLYPQRRLSAYRLRYDMGRATIVKPTWSSNQNEEEEDGFLDVNVSLRLSDTSNDDELTAEIFAPHETITSTLGKEGIEKTTFVKVHCETIGYLDTNDDGVDNSFVGPFPVTKERTRVLVCKEHDDFPGWIDDYKLEDACDCENYEDVLPSKCRNIIVRGGGDDDQMEIEETASTSGDDAANDVSGVRGVQGEKVARAGSVKKKDNGSANVGKNQQKRRKRNEAAKKNDGKEGVAKSPEQLVSRKINRSAIAAAVSGEKKGRASAVGKNIPARTTASTKGNNSAAASTSSAKKSTTVEDSKVARDEADKDETAAPLKESEKAAKKKPPFKKTASKKNTEEEEVNENKSKKPPIPKSTKQKSEQNQQDGKKNGLAYPTGNTDEHILAKPAKGLPTGWTTRRIPRKNNIKLGDSRYYSPKMDFMFRGKPDANRFLEKLEEADGDETTAMMLFKGNKRKSTPISMGKKSGTRVGNSDHGAENGEETANATSKGRGKRKIETSATKQASQELTSEKEEDASKPLTSEGPKKKSKLTKKNIVNAKKAGNGVKGTNAGKTGGGGAKVPIVVYVEKKSSENNTNSPAKKRNTAPKARTRSGSKKEIDPNKPKQPPNAFISFCQDVRPKFAKENPSLTPAQVRSKISHTYRNLGEDKLQPYKDEAARALKKYKADTISYEAKLA